MPYASLAEVPAQVATHDDIPLTLAQANWVAEVADAVEAEDGAEEPWAVAWAQFEEKYEVCDGAWVEKPAEKAAAQEAAEVPPFERKPHHEFVRMQEAPVGSGTQALGNNDHRVEIMAHGWTADGKRYYPKDTLAVAVAERIFDDAKMCINHEPVVAQVKRGHRDLTGWGATIMPRTVEFTGESITAIAHAHSAEAQAILNDPVARKAVALSADIGLAYFPGRIDGKSAEVVERITECHSVDLVPAGNAHGRVLEAASQSKGEMDMDMQDLTNDELQATRPDLVEAIEARAQEAAKADVAKAIEDAETEAVEEYKRAQEAEAAKAKEAEEEAAKKEADPDGAEFAARVQEAVTEATADMSAEVAEMKAANARRDTAEVTEKLVQEAEGLTDASRRRIIAELAGQTIPAADLPARVQEAVEAAKTHEMDMLKEMGVGTQVKGAGATGATVTKEAQEAYEADFTARLREAGYSQADIDKLMAVR